MNRIPTESQKQLEQLIVNNVPRDALMALEDACFDGDRKGREHGATYAKGHRSSAAGQTRHFRTNESFHKALLVHEAQPTPLRGTRLVVGKLGIFNIARLNVPSHQWTKRERSATRKVLAKINENIARKYVQPDMFSAPSEVINGTIFILGVVDGMDTNGLAQLTQVMVALPAPDMTSWLYIQPMSEILKLYDEPNSSIQPDNARPSLRVQSKKQTGNDKGNQ